mmetsp:Transcript_64115/g.144613  ORF Transcript_64115/g.144613 Transcript_64115/m.144613 type:complete len:210 (+) Transcript_64115:372-1001(+)
MFLRRTDSFFFRSSLICLAVRSSSRTFLCASALAAARKTLSWCLACLFLGSGMRPSRPPEAVASPGCPPEEAVASSGPPMDLLVLCCHLAYASPCWSLERFERAWKPLSVLSFCAPRCLVAARSERVVVTYFFLRLSQWWIFCCLYWSWDSSAVMSSMPSSRRPATRASSPPTPPPTVGSVGSACNPPSALGSRPRAAEAASRWPADAP